MISNTGITCSLQLSLKVMVTAANADYFANMPKKVILTDNLYRILAICSC